MITTKKGGFCMHYAVIEVNGTFFFQLFNTALLICIVIGIPYLIFKAIKRSKAIEKRLDLIEKKLIDKEKP